MKENSNLKKVACLHKNQTYDNDKIACSQLKKIVKEKKCFYNC